MELARAKVCSGPVVKHKLASDIVVKDSTSKILFSLAETDKNIQELTSKRNAIEQNLRGLSDEIAACRARIGSLDVQCEQAQANRSAEEQKLKEEEGKIVERRRQLTALGGVRSAKLIEREIDIASRALEALEKNVLDAASVAESLTNELKEVKERLETLEHRREEETPSAESTLQEIAAKLADVTAEHDTLIGDIDDRLKNLYRKVNTRYPGEAVAVAKNGACRSCYRALPAQMYNQVMAGNRLIQCPGCSRILVYANSDNG